MGKIIISITGEGIVALKGAYLVVDTVIKLLLIQGYVLDGLTIDDLSGRHPL